MAYTNEVRLLRTTDEPVIACTATLWAHWTEIVNDRTRFRQSDHDSATVPVSSAFRFTTGRGPSFADIGRSIGLTLHNTDVQMRSGPWFRSGTFDTLPTPFPEDPNGFIDVILAPAVEMTVAELSAGLPATPFRPPGRSEVVTGVALAATGAGVGTRTMTLTVTGTSGATTFTYTLEFRLRPSNDVFALATVIELEVVADNLSFTANPGGGLQAWLKNLVAGWIENSLTRSVASTIASAASTAAMAAAGRALPGGTLPEGVVLSFREVSHLPTGIRVWPALGAFGSIFARLPAPPGGGGAGQVCPARSMAALPAAGIDLGAFRRARDGAMAATPGGVALRGAYYRHAAEVSRLLARRPRLAAELAAVARAVQGPLAEGGPLPAWAVARARAGAEQLAHAGSPALRAEVRGALADEERLLAALGVRRGGPASA